LIQRIEDHALLRIDGGKLQDIAAAHESHGNVVAMVQRARSSRGDPGRLETGLGEHQYLRRLRHSQGFEQRREIAEILVVRQLDFALGQPLVKRVDAVVDRTVGVANRRAVHRQDCQLIDGGDGERQGRKPQPQKLTHGPAPPRREV
jgi:hypothetical protein